MLWCDPEDQRTVLMLQAQQGYREVGVHGEGRVRCRLLQEST